MVTQIMSDVYRIEVPIPNNPLKALNCYVICSKGRFLVIDTGFNRPECKQTLYKGLLELNVDLSKTDVLITHMHADHSGLVADLVQSGAKAYCSREDADIINSGENQFLKMDVFVRTGGFPATELMNAIHKHPGYKYRAPVHVDFSVLEDGHELTVGEFIFTCIKTPGHTRGHLCLFEKNKKLFFSGDHILDSITPNISLWSDTFDPLKNYLNSLDKVYNLDVDWVLPGHRSVITDLKKRIDELKEHHRIRANEALEIINSHPYNAYEVAARMTWDLTYKSFDEFPIAQKWFAAGEALAHLKYLEGEGFVRREHKDGVLQFHAVKQQFTDNGA